MNLNHTLQVNKTFAQDVLKGLSASPKSLSSKYFYNEKGDAIFQAIMGMDEYYLTRSEFAILSKHKSDLLQLFKEGNATFELIEFGAGDGYKTKILLEHFQEMEADFRYLPVDISSNVLEILVDDLKENIPDLEVAGIQGDYFKSLGNINASSHVKKVVLFLGSNIGNFRQDEAVRFLSKIAENFTSADLLMIGFDLKKDPARILDAYNDKQGITKAFNMNLLQRINDELGGSFNLDKFLHYPVYDPMTGETRSYLVSREEQVVSIGALEKEFRFKAWEVIFMEISQKYDLEGIALLADLAGFEVKRNLFDENNYFVDSVWGLK